MARIHLPGLVNLVKDNIKDGIQIAEVGVWHGLSMAAYLDIVKSYNGTIYAVDWFCGSKLSDKDNSCPGEYNSENKNHNLKRFNKNIKNDPCVIVLNGDSSLMSKNIPDNSLDICCIDADHRYKGVIKDICAYLPKMKSGGILCGDDCECYPEEFMDVYKNLDLDPHKETGDKIRGHRYHFGVIKAVHDVFQTWTSIKRHMWRIDITNENKDEYIKSGNNILNNYG